MFTKNYTDKVKSKRRFVRSGIFTLFILAAAFIFMKADTVYASSQWVSLYGDHKDDDIGSTSRNNIISFKNDIVEAGVPLKVLGAPKGSTYNWTLKSADGKKNTFTTTANSYTPVKADMEKLITVTVRGLDDAVASIYFSSLPVVYINNPTGYYGVNDEYTNAVISMQGNSKFNKKEQFFNGDIKIKLRGRSTRYREKRPFNIKLDSKANLLGMGENKRWTLLANDIDHTLMRNKLIYEFSGAIGMDAYMQSEYVTVIFNNQYYGVYQLCEAITISPERVDIYDWEETAETVSKAIVKKLEKSSELSKEKSKKAADNLEDAMCEDLSWITSPYSFTYDVNQDGTAETYTITDYSKLPKATGGTLIELDMGVHDGSQVSPMLTAYAQPLFFNTPEYGKTNSKLFGYIQKYVQAFEYAIHSTDFVYHEKDKKYQSADPEIIFENPGYKEAVFNAPEYESKHYSQLFDLDSLVQNFIVCEYTMNVDGMRCSGYMYKDIDGLFHMGPEWDFDWAWGNINMYQINTWRPTSWHTTDEALGFTTVQWNQSLIRDPYFITKLYEKYKEIRGTVINDMIKSGGTIDTYEKYLRTPAAANDKKWEYTYTDYKSVGFEGSIVNMRLFLTKRIEWLDAQFESLDTLIASLGYYKPSTGLKVTGVDLDSKKGYAKVTAEVTNTEISKITFQLNGTHSYSEEIVNGQAVCLIPAKDLLSETDRLNVIQIFAKNAEDKYIIDNFDEGNYYNAKSNYIAFYNSNKK